MKISGIPKLTPLYNNHLKLNAKMVDFAGWMLPVQYESIIKEHIHTRTKCSVFDICHMGEFLFEGPNAAEDLSFITTVNAAAMNNGACKYGFILNEDGHFIDDSILYRFNAKKFMLVVNASRTYIDKAWISARLSENTSFNDISDNTAKIDLQGPTSSDAACRAFPEFDFTGLKKFRFSIFKYRGISVTVSSTGYTGEHGYEFFMPSDYAENIWNDLLSQNNVMPAGLGARDSLRLEKGYSLYGHDITEKNNPFEANLGRFITFDHNFLGAQALKEASKISPQKILVPFLCEGRRAARDNYEVFYNNVQIGTVTSGAFSPSLRRGIGLCLIDPDYSSTGSEIVCREHEIEIKAVITELPFI